MQVFNQKVIGCKDCPFYQELIPNQSDASCGYTGKNIKGLYQLIQYRDDFIHEDCPFNIEIGKEAIIEVFQDFQFQPKKDTYTFYKNILSNIMSYAELAEKLIPVMEDNYKNRDAINEIMNVCSTKFQIIDELGIYKLGIRKYHRDWNTAIYIADDKTPYRVFDSYKTIFEAVHFALLWVTVEEIPEKIFYRTISNYEISLKKYKEDDYGFIIWDNLKHRSYSDANYDSLFSAINLAKDYIERKLKLI